VNTEEVIEGFVTYLEEEIRPSRRTRDAYRRIAQRILDADVEPAVWLRDVARGAPRGTVDVYRSAALRFWAYLEELGEDAGPKPSARVAQEESPPPEGLTDEELAAYYRIVQDMDEPHCTILALLPRTGLRISEACHLELEEIRRDRVDGQPKWGLRVRGKGRGGMEDGGGKVRWVPLTAAAQRLLARYLAEREDLFPAQTRWVFPSPQKLGAPYTADAVRKAWRDVRAVMGLSEATPHVLRHTFAHRFLDHNGYEALPALQSILGHASLETTRRYAKESRDQLRGLVDGMEDPDDAANS